MNASGSLGAVTLHKVLNVLAPTCLSYLYRWPTIDDEDTVDYLHYKGCETTLREGSSSETDVFWRTSVYKCKPGQEIDPDELPSEATPISELGDMISELTKIQLPSMIAQRFTYDYFVVLAIDPKVIR
ncbi:hypothetical protein E1B28_002562 [Marasmius oreades]|nr:uncharacterized protein E1B28_002562 [Marasmius oreades]KAG7086619.1 hypothetical protein E1B28_002562 [Marasmius oreades]